MTVGLPQAHPSRILGPHWLLSSAEAAFWGSDRGSETLATHMEQWTEKQVRPQPPRPGGKER